jgi:monoamine oxidase
MKKFRTPLGRMLARSLEKALAMERHPNQFPDASALEAYRHDQSRRRFLTQATVGGLALYAGVMLPGCGIPSKVRNADSGPRIAIIGAGIAGLNCAYQLRKRGYTSTVYEASSRVGGRMFSSNQVLGHGLVTELGAEFIDSDHRDMLRLVKEFKLDMLDMQAPSERGLIGETAFINGRLYNETEVLEVFRGIAPRIAQDAAAVTDEISYASATPRELELDNINLLDYLRQMDVPNWFLTMMDVAYTSEMGIEASEQSALNLITFISTDTAHFRIFGDSDERFKVIGGNHRIIEKLAEQLDEAQVQTGKTLEAVRRKGTKYQLVFQGQSEVEADYVVLSLPFTKLRELEFDVELPPAQQRAIREQAYGTNTKYFLGMSERVWRKQGYSGYLFNELVQNGWDNSQGQLNNQGPGGYTVFLGGKAGYAREQPDPGAYLPTLDGMFPGIMTAFNGKEALFNWGRHPFTQGSYSTYSVGQWTSIGGAQALPGERMYFAGEHCSDLYQGYMNGGAETGRLAAESILKHIKA